MKYPKARHFIGSILEPMGWFILLIMLLYIWREANAQLILDTTHAINPFSPKLIPYTYWPHYVFQHFGPFCIVLPYFIPALTKQERRTIIGSLLMAITTVFLLSFVYTSYSIEPGLLTYSILKNNNDSEISARYDPQVRLEIYYTPRTDEATWIINKYIPSLIQKYGDSIHILCYDRTDRKVKKHLFYKSYRLGYFDDDPIFLEVSSCQPNASRVYIRREDIIHECDSFIFACLNPIQREHVSE